MKKRAKLLTLILLLTGYAAIAQETPPAGLLPVNAQFYIHLPDSTIWHDKGSPYGWERLGRYKDVVNATTAINVEQYRQAGMTDDAVIQAAIDAAGKGKTLYLGQNKTYTITNSVLMDSLQTLVGRNSTIKRAAQTTTTLSASASQSASTITVASVPANWKAGDYVQLYTDSTWKKSTVLSIQIAAISGNTISLSRTLNASGDGTITTWPSGTVVRKIYYMFSSKVDGYSSNQAYIMRDIKFDGNKANNKGNYYWFANGTMFMGGFQSAVINCKFRDMPNENIVGHGFHIEDCYAENLNGSFVHMSGDFTLSSKEKKNAWIVNNTTYNTNIMSSDNVTGHSQGVINLSFQGGWFSATGNRLFNGGESVLGQFGSDDNVAITKGENEIVFTGNLAVNFKQIINSFSTNYNNSPKHNNLSGNLFYNCGANNWGTYAMSFGIGFTGNKLMGGTTVTSAVAPMMNIDSTAVLIDGSSVKLVKAPGTPGTGANVLYRNPDGTVSAGTPPTIPVQYWSRSGTTLSPGNSGDNILASDVISSSGGFGRFGGWDTGNGYRGPALEGGYYSGSVYLNAYNRSTAAFLPLVIQGSSISMGIGNVSITNALTVNGGITTPGDVTVSNPANGLILYSPNGTRYRMQVSNAGALTVTSF